MAGWPANVLPHSEGSARVPQCHWAFIQVFEPASLTDTFEKNIRKAAAFQDDSKRFVWQIESSIETCAPRAYVVLLQGFDNPESELRLLLLLERQLLAWCSSSPFVLCHFLAAQDSHSRIRR